MKSKIRYIAIAVVLSALFSQSEIDKYIEQVEQGEIRSAFDALSGLRVKYPENPSLLYLEALLTVDTKESVKLFKKLFDYYKDSEYADDAIMKMAEYYYTEGSYETSSYWLSKINLYYSDSEHVNRGMNMYIRTLMLSGREDTAKIYSKAFNKKYPDLTLDEKIRYDLSKIEEEPVQEAVEAEGNEKSTILQTVENITNTITAPDKNRKDHYSIQLGAYSSMQNAIQVRDELLEAGFNARIDLIYLETKNKNLYAVREGYFTSKEYAKNTRKKIQSRTGYPCIIIDINKY